MVDEAAGFEAEIEIDIPTHVAARAVGARGLDPNQVAAFENVTEEDELVRMRHAKEMYRANQKEEKAAGELVGFLINNETYTKSR
jgi:hypothetical protein